MDAVSIKIRQVGAEKSLSQYDRNLNRETEMVCDPTSFNLKTGLGVVCFFHVFVFHFPNKLVSLK